MKPALNEVAKALEDIATRVAAIEAALIAHGYLTLAEIDFFAVKEHWLQHGHLATLRSRIASLST